jgi:hypothetical protein
MRSDFPGSGDPRFTRTRCDIEDAIAGLDPGKLDEAVGHVLRSTVQCDKHLLPSGRCVIPEIALFAQDAFRI